VTPNTTQNIGMELKELDGTKESEEGPEEISLVSVVKGSINDASRGLESLPAPFCGLHKRRYFSGNWQVLMLHMKIQVESEGGREWVAGVGAGAGVGS
jgi:hypothetical protein